MKENKDTVPRKQRATPAAYYRLQHAFPFLLYNPHITLQQGSIRHNNFHLFDTINLKKKEKKHFNRLYFYIYSARGNLSPFTRYEIFNFRMAPG